MAGQIPLGNGEFCLNADAAGLQTFGGSTLSHWAWHSAPLPPGCTPADLPPTGSVEKGRITGPMRKASERRELDGWMFRNPHLINLGRRRFLRSTGAVLEPREIGSVSRRYDLWTGMHTSRFEVDGQPVVVEACVHPTLDVIAGRAESPLLRDGKQRIPSKILMAFWTAAEPAPSNVRGGEYVPPQFPRLPLTKLMDTPLRDTSICLGPDGDYCMAGTVEPFWGFNEGIKLWKSPDLANWTALGFVWRYGASPWHKKYIEAKKPLWAPEVHYLKGTFWLTYSMPGWDGTAKTSGSGLLRSTTGKPEGPYADVQPAERMGDEIDASIFDGRYSCAIATSTNIYGPYGERCEAIPHGGHNTFFQDKSGHWRSTYFGSDDTAPWQERPGVLPISFDSRGKVVF